MNLELPAALRQAVALLGMALASAMAILFLALLPLEAALGFIQNPSFGLLLCVCHNEPQ
jgi:hypothetical protein